MLVHRDSWFARCPFWFVASSPMIDVTTEMLDTQQRQDSTFGKNCLEQSWHVTGSYSTIRAQESPIAMGQSRDNNAMNPSRISRRF